MSVCGFDECIGGCRYKDHPGSPCYEVKAVLYVVAVSGQIHQQFEIEDDAKEFAAKMEDHGFDCLIIEE